MQDQKIDFVIPWVDDSDPIWREDKNKYWNELDWCNSRRIYSFKRRIRLFNYLWNTGI